MFAPVVRGSPGEEMTAVLRSAENHKTGVSSLSTRRTQPAKRILNRAGVSARVSAMSSTVADESNE